MRRYRRLTAILLAVAVFGGGLAGCASDGAVYGSTYYGVGYGYYDRWYGGDIIVTPRPPRPEHPIERPPNRPRPPARPTPLPARPMPRPAPRRMR